MVNSSSFSLPFRIYFKFVFRSCFLTSFLLFYLLYFLPSFFPPSFPPFDPSIISFLFPPFSFSSFLLSFCLCFYIPPWFSLFSIPCPLSFFLFPSFLLSFLPFFFPKFQFPHSVHPFLLPSFLWFWPGFILLVNLVQFLAFSPSIRFHIFLIPPSYIILSSDTLMQYVSNHQFSKSIKIGRPWPYLST